MAIPLPPNEANDDEEECTLLVDIPWCWLLLLLLLLLFRNDNKLALDAEIIPPPLAYILVMRLVPLPLLVSDMLVFAAPPPVAPPVPPLALPVLLPLFSLPTLTVLPPLTLAVAAVVVAAVESNDDPGRLESGVVAVALAVALAVAVAAVNGGCVDCSGCVVDEEDEDDDEDDEEDGGSSGKGATDEEREDRVVFVALSCPARLGKYMNVFGLTSSVNAVPALSNDSSSSRSDSSEVLMSCPGIPSAPPPPPPPDVERRR